MDLIADRGRRVSVEELNTTKLLAHGAEQAKQRKLEEVLIVELEETVPSPAFIPFLKNITSLPFVFPEPLTTILPERIIPLVLILLPIPR